MSDQDKILVISTTPFFGGGESFIVNTLSRINKDVHYLVRNEELAASLPDRKTRRFSSHTFFRQVEEINRTIADIRATHVLLNGGSAIYFAPFIKCKRKIIYRHTTNHAVSNRIKRLLYVVVMHCCYAFANRIVHVSAYALKEQKLFKSKACYIHHGIDLKPRVESRVPASPIRILFVGRTDIAKGIDLIVDAFKMLPDGSARLDVVGRGDFEKRLDEETDPSIVYHGFRKSVDEYYQKADVFVSLPVHEAFGLTFIEAMQYGLPVISCDTGGVSEIVKDGVTGLLVPRSANAVYRAMLRLCTDREFLVLLGENAYRDSALFSRTKTIEAIESLF